MTVAARFDPLDPVPREEPFGLLAVARRVQRSSTRPPTVAGCDRYEDVVRLLKTTRRSPPWGASLFARAFAYEVRAVLAEGWPETPLFVETGSPLDDGIRGLVTAAFTPRHRRARATDWGNRRRLLGGFASAGRADLIARVAGRLPLHVLGELPGLPGDDLGRLHELGQDWLLLQQPGPTDELVERARCFVELRRYFRPRDRGTGARAAR